MKLAQKEMLESKVHRVSRAHRDLGARKVKKVIRATLVEMAQLAKMD